MRRKYLGTVDVDRRVNKAGIAWDHSVRYSFGFERRRNSQDNKAKKHSYSRCKSCLVGGASKVLHDSSLNDHKDDAS